MSCERCWAKCYAFRPPTAPVFDRRLHELSDQDKLVYVNNVLMGKLLESEKLKQQANNNTKEQFANSPDLKAELMLAIISALDAHTAMSTHAINSEAVRAGLLQVLINHAGLHERLRSKQASENESRK